MQLMLKIGCLMIFALCSLQGRTQELFARSGIFSPFEPVKMESFQKLKETNTIGKYPILFVGDEWLHLQSSVKLSEGVPIPLAREYAIAVRGDKFFSSIDIEANLAEGNASNWNSQPCKRDDYLWKRSIGRAFEDVNCVSINHIVNFFVKPTGDFQQMLVLLNDKNIEPPPTIIKVTFTRYSNRGRILTYAVNINPEKYGIARDASINWGSSGWHKSFISRDSKKVEFLSKLQKWAEDVQNRMDAAFDKKLDAFNGLDSLDDYLTTKKSIEAVKDSEEQIVETKLKSIKNLYEKNLISESQYDEQVRSILNGK